MRLLTGGPIRVGDATTGGGVVLPPGENSMPIEGGGRTANWVARGATAQCCGGIQTFKEGCVGHDVNGRGLVLEGHLLTCGHYAISSCPTEFMVTDTMPPGGPPADAAAPTRKAAAPMPAEDGLEHWLDLNLTNNGERLPNQRYVVTDAAGQVHEGVLDGNAYARVSPLKPGTCRVDFPDLGYSATVEVS